MRGGLARVYGCYHLVVFRRETFRTVVKNLIIICDHRVCKRAYCSASSPVLPVDLPELSRRISLFLIHPILAHYTNTDNISTEITGTTLTTVSAGAVYPVIH